MVSPRGPATPDAPSPAPRLGVPVPRHISFYAPSPASTHGETDAGDSMPSTPAKLNNDPAILSHSLRPYQLRESDENDESKPRDVDPLFQAESPAFSTNETHQQTLGSPSIATGSTRFMHLEPGISVLDSQRMEALLRNHSWQSHEGDPFFAGSGTQALDAAQAELDPIEYKPREDREMAEISGDNAQAIFSPNACVFVANLAATATDEHLELETTRTFEQFGKVYVKIKRDARGMPYAFCQYEKEADAEKAIAQGHGLSIAGRQCRTERAKVNRSLYLSRTAGGTISEEEARRVLAEEGPLEKLWVSTNTDREMFRLPHGIWVTFAYFQDCRDAQTVEESPNLAVSSPLTGKQTFKDNKDYRLEQPSVPDDVRQRLSRPRSSPGSRATPSRNRVATLNPHTNRYANCSIFVGNLPMTAALSQLRDMFGECGYVRAVEIISKANMHSSGSSAFAFIEYASEREARNAVSRDHVLDGRRLRVEMRESQEHALSRGSPFASGGSPSQRGGSGAGAMMTPHTPHTPATTTEAAMSRALALGVPASTLMQIFDVPSVDPLEALTQTPLGPSVYAQPQYYGSPYSAPPFGHYMPLPPLPQPQPQPHPPPPPQPQPANVAETSSAALPVYGQVGGMQPSVGQYPYHNIVGTQYAPAYPYSTYVYPSAPSEPSAPHDPHA